MRTRRAEEAGLISVPIALLCVYIFQWFLQLGVRVDFFGKIRFELILGVALVVLSILNRRSQINKFKSDIGESRVIKATVTLLVCMLIQIPLSFNVDLSWAVFFDRVVKFGMMALFISTLVKSPRDLVWVLCSMLLAWGFITQESFRAALDGSMVWENQGVPRLHGDTPMYRHPNSLAGLAIGVLPFTLCLFPVFKGYVVRGILVVISFTALGCILYSGSRTAYLGTVFLLAFLVGISKYKMKAALIIAAIVPLVWAGLPDIYKARFDTMITGQEIEGDSMGARKEILIDALTIFSEHPFGVGVAAFPTVRAEKFGRMQDTHNLYLEVATNLGIQGLIAFFIFIFLLLKTLFRVRHICANLIDEIRLLDIVGNDIDSRSKSEMESRMWNIKLISAVAVAVTGYLSIRLVLGLFGMDMYEIYWWVALGFCLALCRLFRQEYAAVYALISTCKTKCGSVNDRGQAVHR